MAKDRQQTASTAKPGRVPKTASGSASARVSKAAAKLPKQAAKTSSKRKAPAKPTAYASPLEEALGYGFADSALLELALTHRSHTYEANAGPDTPPLRPHREARNTPGTDNEQLEFLGDAVLGFAITELLFEYFPDRSEGELTRLRAALVSRDRMAALGAYLALGEHLRLGRSAEQTGGRSKPALLANAAEAVLAAIYLDAVRSGRDGVAEIRRLAHTLLLTPELDTLRAALANDGGRGALRDAKTLLQERVQAESAGRLRYADTAESGPAHQRRFVVEARLEDLLGHVEVLASAEGGSKKEAQQRAADLALQHWKPQAQRGPATGNEEDATR